ncbi:MAG: phytanoyl-CoA dioxygenase family protein [Candidatus Latescibacterota bacterium]|nr:phytanoyl-CoA dioxygenase family protein [Candidatus Latescibacterota bacterium]
MQAEVEFFRANGYLVVPDVLSAVELTDLNRAIDIDREQYPQLWQNRREGGRYQSGSVLLSSKAFDATIRHPAILALVEELMGEELCFEELSVMIREPLAADPPEAGWHRDTDHWPEHPLALKNLSLVYYLTDVDAESHCFAVLPEGVEAKRANPGKPDPAQGVELYGRAGTAILFNAGSGHAGVVKRATRERRTIHIYYGHRSLPHLSNHTVVPRRLLEGGDQGSRRFYGRPNLATELALANF